jgi:hypothetical protein
MNRPTMLRGWYVAVWAACFALSACQPIAAPPMCSRAQTLCAGECIDVSSDPAHCGACATACAAAEVCAGGACDAECPADQTECDAGCFDTETWPTHCGDCATSCASDEICAGGACRASCRSNSPTLCGSECVDTDVSHDHCGECGVACAANEVCSGGICGSVCTGATATLCSETCVDTEIDRQHCGGCDAACATGEVCTGGACGTACGGATPTRCDDQCANTDVDRHHCGTCDSPCGADEGCVDGACVTIPAVDGVDLLLMIDNSNSMTEEQVSFVREIPAIVRALTSGDRDLDGLPDFRPATSLHIGVVSSDMGTGSVEGIESCDAGLGDDGVMWTRGSARAGCMATYPSAIFEFVAEGGDATAFATSVGCVASIGTDGCGFEHQLEAPLKALSLVPSADGASPVAWTRPGYRPPVFLGTTFGHGGAGGRNDGFLRAGSVLAIVLVTDEEDCSASDPLIFDRLDPAYSSVDLNLRCHTFTEAQYTIDRYVDGFIGLRSDARRLVFAAITGVPLEAVDRDLDYEEMLALPAMQEQIDPVLRNRLLPSCTSPDGRGVAYPPRRIVQVAEGLDRLGARTTVQSICDAGFTSAVEVIIDRIADANGGPG